MHPRGRLVTEPFVIVHGGATTFTERYHSEIISTVQQSASHALHVLENGGSALDAVEAAIWIMEETELFTAGKGACKNLDGEIEVDAIIMDGNRLESGAVMSARNLVHPISLARYVLERTSVYQVVGTGANRLYEQMVKEGYRKERSTTCTNLPPIAEPSDTVGAIAVDEMGRIAVGNSTSGWPGKLPGRVGDSPIIGAGAYANEKAAAACTGKGEQILRIVMARIAVLHIEHGLDARSACNRAVQELRQKTSGEAGLIMATPEGDFGFDYDTQHMPIAIAKVGKGVFYASIKPKWPI